MNSHATDHGHTATSLPFSEEEVRALHFADIQAGAAIIYLMTGVFSTGLLLYIFVAFTVVWQW